MRKKNNVAQYMQSIVARIMQLMLHITPYVPMSYRSHAHESRCDVHFALNRSRSSSPPFQDCLLLSRTFDERPGRRDCGQRGLLRFLGTTSQAGGAIDIEVGQTA